jgi:hypothetical protein
LCDGKNLALLQAEASVSGIELVNVPNVRRLFFTMNANVWRYEIVGDCGILSCPVTPNLMRGRNLA